MYQKKNILLIDDDDISNFLTATVLKNSGVANNIQVCTDGEAALDLIKSQVAANQLCPDLILLDINMPRMNGFDFLTSFRNLNGCLNTPVIIILTTSNNYQDFEELKNYPEVEVYLNKPLTEDSLDYINDKYFSQPFSSLT